MPTTPVPNDEPIAPPGGEVVTATNLPPQNPEPLVTPATPAGAVAASELAPIRDLLLRAYPDIVPDLIAGATIPELLASVEPAREAYARVAATIAPKATSESPTAPAITVPAGGGAPLPIDPERLPASEKIRRGLLSLRRA